MTSFKRNLIIGYSLSLALLVASAAASLLSINGLMNSAELVNHTNDVLRKLEDVLAIMKEAESGTRGYLLTNNERFLDRYTGSYEQTMDVVRQIRMLTADNPQQQTDIDLLRSLAAKRLEALANLVDSKTAGKSISDTTILQSKDMMDQVRKLVNTMQDREEALMVKRTEDWKKFAASTPAFLIVASLLSLLVTLVSLYRVSAGYNKQKALQGQLEQANEDISHRIHTVETVTSKIAAGNFSTRVTEEESQNLGGLATSLNKMAASLEESFTSLADKEWQQAGIAELNEKLIGEKNMQNLATNALEFLTRYTGSQAGAFYFGYQGNGLQLGATTGLDRSRMKDWLEIGEGFAGRSAAQRKMLTLTVPQDAELQIDYSGGSFKPKSIIALPIVYENIFKGVVELASLQPFSTSAQNFLQSVAFNIGIAVHSVRDHERQQELLAETQAQSEELQAQHSELENVNAELKAQAEKLQASEEELRVQQEELQQANGELEERSRLLEEKNEAILERNLDIQRKAEELALSTKYKSEFLANMSHELRTPLNSILLLSRLLSENHESNLSGDQVEYANVIQNSGKSLLTLIDEILDLSKIEAGKMDLDYADVSVQEVADALRSLFAPMAKDKGLTFSIDVSPDTPSHLQTDRLRLEQILRNLLSNALKFTRHGSVTLLLKPENGELSFAVKDTGIGIAAEKQQTIFEAFQQADGSTRRQFGGTGLGLSISRELARLLGGNIRLESEAGKGSEFTLILPMKKGTTVVEEPKVEAPARAEAKPNDPVLSHQSQQPSQPSSPSIPPSVPDDRETITAGDKVILIVEDDTAFARSLLDYTHSKGYKGLVAVRGDEGLELARRFQPVGILLDIQLPVKSGWDVMDELKSDPATRPIPVHMMSSLQARNKSLSKGAVDFIDKPVAFEQLGNMFSKIEEALSRYPKKVLIVEENHKHAQALAYFLENYSVHAEIKNNVNDGVKALNRADVDCVILDMGVPAQRSYSVLEDVKKTPGLEQLPIIVFTGKNLSHVEEMKIRQYADSIVVKTAQSYRRILDEVSLFLNLVEENRGAVKPQRYKKMGELTEVLKGKTVLVADDDVRNIFSLTKSLENYGVNVISAIDGKDALRQLGETPRVDLVLMDMMMPEMDGYESTRRIREQPQYRNLPIIAVTAKAMLGDREKCIAAGASDYITKPVDVDQLLSLLRVWLYA